MKILISGGVGFIGSNLCLSLVKDGHEVYVIDDCSTGKNWEEIKKIVHRAERLNIASHVIPTRVFCNLEVVFNLVGRTSHSGSMMCPILDAESNLMAPLKILDLVKQFSPEAKVIYTGTRGQYGKILQNPVNENHPINPLDINGINKYAAEQQHILYHKYYGMKTFGLRLTNVFGPRHQMDTPDGVLNWFIAQALRNEPIRVSEALRDALYIDDCIEALKATMYLDDKYAGEVFNIGSGTSISLEEYVKIINKYVPLNYTLLKKENKLEIGTYVANISKFKNASGWEPKCDLTESIKKTIDFYKGKV